MSTLSIGPEPGYKSHLEERIEKLFRFDIIRINELLELVQYTVIYAVTCFFTGLGINSLFPEYDENKPTGYLIAEILGELSAVIIAIFYIRKINKLIPFFLLAGNSKSYIPYQTTEYNGEITISLIFVAMQFRLLKKIGLLGQRMNEVIFGAKGVKSISMTMESK
jgi:hypothetical protein